jgi:hypothetical protein
MTPIKNRALRFAALAGLIGILLGSVLPAARGQAGPSSAAPTQQIIKVHYQVVHMGYESIQVSEFTNPRALHTFLYSPAIRGKMQALFNAGGYQYGDRVLVWHQRGGEVALKIKGKPSKTQ